MSDEIEQLVDNLSSASRGDGIEFVAAGDTVDSAAEVAAARAGLLSAVAALRSERDDARERHETASRELRILGVVNDSLRAENERLRADAERYRWLRDATALSLRSKRMKWTRTDGSTYTSTHVLQANDTQYPSAPTLDEMIDAALEHKHG